MGIPLGHFLRESFVQKFDADGAEKPKKWKSLRPKEKSGIFTHKKTTNVVPNRQLRSSFLFENQTIIAISCP
jgi:hypothetical protein